MEKRQQKDKVAPVRLHAMEASPVTGDKAFVVRDHRRVGAVKPRLRWALGACGLFALSLYTASIGFQAPPAPQQELGMDDHDKGKEVVGVDIRSSSTGGAPANGAEIVNSGPGIGADIAVSGNGASSVTGLRVIQQGPGTGLRIIQQGPGTGMRVRVGN